MPKVTGPLFSINASGSVAKLLTFRNTAHGFIVQRCPQNIVSASEWQLIERQTMRDAAAAWAALDSQTKAIWGNNSLPTIRSAWMDFFQEWKAQRIAPGALPLIPSRFIGVPPRLPFPDPPAINDLGLLPVIGLTYPATRGGTVSANRGAPTPHGSRAGWLHSLQFNHDRGPLIVHGARAALHPHSLPGPDRGTPAPHGSRAGWLHGLQFNHDRGPLVVHGSRGRNLKT